MYLLLPVLFSFARRESSSWTILLLWLVACLLNLASYGPHAGNGLYMVIPHFLPGVMAYIGFRTYKAKLPPWLFAACILILLALFMAGPEAKVGWIVCLFIGLLLPHFRDTQSRWIERVSHPIAIYSYGIYLLHLPCLTLCFKYLSGHSLPTILATGLLLTAASAAAAYHLIEEPMIHLGHRIAQAVTDRRSAKLIQRDLVLEVAP